VSVQLKYGLSVEMDCSMSELAENAPVDGSVLKNKRGRRILIFCAVSVINVGLLAFILTQLLTPAPASRTDPLIDHPAPNFSLTMLSTHASTGVISLSDFKGKAVVLNFWASWCDPCQQEAPLLENAWKQAQSQGKDVIFLGIDFQESSSAGTGFLKQYGITYPAAMDTDGSVANKYGVTSLPVTIFIQQNGTVASRVAQQLTSQSLASNLQLIMPANSH
jgi:cytochrome c biogenesis protein CcmG, thiol:disulfide interchange protein DsbE